MKPPPKKKEKEKKGMDWNVEKLWINTSTTTNQNLLFLSHIYIN